MPNTPYDPMDLASLRLWRQDAAGGNSEQVRRLLTNLPVAVEQELTRRERQILRMHFTRNMRVTDIARELGIQKSTVSRSLSRAMEKLYRALRYSL
ncbi:MAG: sigma-70 family RNA polymerase sigma factor [Clostridiales bacterium]|nr:sigma-70 family RNA polymerase sigma factor [Candidatus Cacconaster stercorequi]